ncbi:MAG TPA: hypothetical protein VMW69_13370 [Spirochaetia bacterium]|nr:hypothetical protein [Spirochaetia bacterium]
MSWLLSVYIGATIFGAGITLIDLFGLFGSHDGDHTGDDSSGHTIEGESGGDTVDGGLGDHESDASGEAQSPEAMEHDGSDEHEGSLAGHDRPDRRSFLLGLLSVFRNIIYFCLGFGPVGWFALATSGSLATSLLWSAPVGVAALFGTRTLRRFMRRELNSQIATSELLMERGEVTVSIGAGEMGKVRIKLGDVYVDRYARAASAEKAIHVGASVRVTDVGDDCVYVEEE